MTIFLDEDVFRNKHAEFLDTWSTFKVPLEVGPNSIFHRTSRLHPLRLERQIVSKSMLDILRYEYIALAKKSFVLRELTLLLFNQREML